MSNRNYIRGVNAERIRWALDEFRIDIGDFGQQIGMPSFIQKLSKDDFTFNQLKNIADTLGYGVLFFMEKGLPNAERVHSTHYRTLANQNIDFDADLSKIIKQAERHREIYLSIHEELDEPLADFEPPRLIGTIKEKAQAIRHWLGLSLGEKYEFAEYRKRIINKGILVFQSMGYSGKWKVKNNDIDGFAMSYSKAPLIFIVKGSDEANVFKSKARQSFTLFHELAHILLHKQDKIDNTDTINDAQNTKEQEANRFAGLCLVPDEEIVDISIPDYADDYQQWFGELATHIGVSVEVIVRCLLDSNKITKEDYDEYVEWYYSSYYPSKGESGVVRTYRHREPLHIFGEPYVRTILSGLAERQITLNKASDYLDGLSIPDIKELARYLNG